MRELTPVKALRELTRIINPKQAVTIIMLVNLLARYMDNDELLDKNFLIETFEKTGIKLILEGK